MQNEFGDERRSLVGVGVLDDPFKRVVIIVGDDPRKHKAPSSTGSALLLPPSASRVQVINLQKLCPSRLCRKFNIVGDGVPDIPQTEIENTDAMTLSGAFFICHVILYGYCYFHQDGSSGTPTPTRIILR